MQKTRLNKVDTRAFTSDYRQLQAFFFPFSFLFFLDFPKRLQKCLEDPKIQIKCVKSVTWFDRNVANFEDHYKMIETSDRRGANAITHHLNMIIDSKKVYITIGNILRSSN